MICISSDENKAKIIRKAKLYMENIPIYFKAFPGLYLVYVLKVMRLAREAMSGPAPPILTPISKGA